MEFIHESNRIYLNDAQGRLVAEVTFPELVPGIVEINHTFVDDSLRGQGVAGKLMEAAAESLLESGRKAKLTCSYAIKWFGSHPEHAAVCADDT